LARPRLADAVLFDLDGTLIDTIPLIFASYRHTLEVHLPGYHPGRDAIVARLGRSLDTILRDFASEAGAVDPDALSQVMKQTYRSFQRANLARLVRPYEGMREVLKALREHGIRLGVVTSKVEWAARMGLDHYGLGEFFEIEVFHDDTRRHKPDPEPLLFAVRKGGLEEARTAYVGDSVNDMAAGRAAGMQTIGALWGPSPREALLAAGADTLAEKPADLLSLVCGADPGQQREA
jgi:pyrophosphatase PpaX